MSAAVTQFMDLLRAEWPRKIPDAEDAQRHAVWTDELEDVAPEVLAKVGPIILKKQKFPPGLPDILEYIDRATTRSGAKGGPAQGCEDCRSSGRREIARHWTDPDGWQHAEVYAACCDCRLGRSLAGDGWRETVDAMRKAESTTAVFVTDRDFPVLTPEQRETPERLQRLAELRRAAPPARYRELLAAIQQQHRDPHHAHRQQTLRADHRRDLEGDRDEHRHQEPLW